MTTKNGMRALEAILGFMVALGFQRRIVLIMNKVTENRRGTDILRIYIVLKMAIYVV